MHHPAHPYRIQQCCSISPSHADPWYHAGGLFIQLVIASLIASLESRSDFGPTGCSFFRRA
jgi:hypothetical protein